MKKVSVVLFAFSLSFSACTKCAECTTTPTNQNGMPLAPVTEKYCGESLTMVEQHMDCN